MGKKGKYPEVCPVSCEETTLYHCENCLFREDCEDAELEYERKRINRKGGSGGR